MLCTSPRAASPRALLNRVFGFQGRPGLCPPVPPSSADPQRAEEHPSGEGHAHHHQVKPPPPGAGWGSAGVGLARFGLPNPQSSTCALPRGLGTWDGGAGRGAWVQECCWGCSQKHSLAGKRSLILPAIFLLFTLELFTLKCLKTQPAGPVQTRSRQPGGAGAALLHAAPAMCWGGERVSVPSLRFFSFPSRNKETSRDEFIFYSKRLMRLLIEHALSFLPFQVGSGLYLGDDALSSLAFRGARPAPGCPPGTRAPLRAASVPVVTLFVCFFCRVARSRPLRDRTTKGGHTVGSK